MCKWKCINWLIYNYNYLLQYHKIKNRVKYHFCAWEKHQTQFSAWYKWYHILEKWIWTLFINTYLHLQIWSKPILTGFLKTNRGTTKQQVTKDIVVAVEDCWWTVIIKHDSKSHTSGTCMKQFHFDYFQNQIEINWILLEYCVNSIL